MHNWKELRAILFVGIRIRLLSKGVKICV